MSETHGFFFYGLQGRRGFIWFIGIICDSDGIQVYIDNLYTVITSIFLSTVILFNKQFHELIPMKLNLNAPKLNKYRET